MKSVYDVKIVWRIREISSDGLLKVPRQSDYGQESNVYNECCGYDSLEEARQAIVSHLNTTRFSTLHRETIAIPCFESEIKGEVEDKDF
jgi:hypothetical protein